MKEVLLRTPFVVRVPGDTLGRRPGSYDDLRQLAAGYARHHLAGRTLVNHATQLGITLTRGFLRAVTRDDAPVAVLRAIPALPSLLSQANYVRSSPDRRNQVDIRSVDLGDTRRMHLLAATAEIAGRPLDLLFRVRETFGGQGFLDRITASDSPDRRRGSGGGLPDNSNESLSETGAAAVSDTTPDASSPQEYATRQPCAAAHRACVLSGRDTKDCLKALNLCRQGIPTIFSPGVWGAPG